MINKNKHINGYQFPTWSEEKLLQTLETIQNNWWFWHEPIFVNHSTPDFVIYINDDNHPLLIILELKNWKNEYIQNIDEKNVILSGYLNHPARIEPHPIRKLERVLNNLNESFSVYYHTCTELKDLSIKLILGFYSIPKNEIPSNILNEQNENILILGKEILRDKNKLHNYFTEIAQESYNEEYPSPPNSRNLKKILNSQVDKSVLVKEASGTIISDDNINSIKYKKELPCLLDNKQQEAAFLKSSGHILLSGMAGTGKSIVLLSRASLHKKNFPDSKILYVVRQDTLSKFLSERYKKHYSTNNQRIEFITFEKWLFKYYKLENKFIYASLNEHEINQIISGINKNNIYPVSNLIEFDLILIDEAHQFDKEWIKLLIKFSKLDKNNNPNIWISYDNGQGIYKNKRFNGPDLNLDFRGRGKVFKKIYRSGMIPWIFAVCCNPKALIEYKKVMKSLSDSSDKIVFDRLGEIPTFIKRKKFPHEQAYVLKEKIENIVNEKYIKMSDITIYYASKNINLNNNLLDLFNEVFSEHGGVEDINKKNVDWSSNKIRVCEFISSQGIDSPVSVLFGIENFLQFKNSKIFDPIPLIYTVLTRSTDKIILTDSGNWKNNFVFKTFYNGFTIFLKLIENKFIENDVIEKSNTYELSLNSLDNNISQIKQRYNLIS